MSMPYQNLAELTSILQASVSPVILISGIGLLLLSMTNRFSRTVDRAREFGHQLQHEPAGNRELLAGQVRILHRRSHLMRQAITLALVSILCLSLLVILLFLSYELKLPWEMLLIVLFLASFVFLIGALVIFIYDFTISLKALDLEINQPR